MGVNERGLIDVFPFLHNLRQIAEKIMLCGYYIVLLMSTRSSEDVNRI